MTVSSERREADIEKCLLRMADSIGDGYYFEQLFAVKDFDDILPTTWRELEEHGFVQGKHAFGNPQYQLTAHGWIEALRLRAGLDDPELRRRAIVLVQALKTIVDGRDQIHDSLADERQLAPSSGLPAGWIHNAMKAGLLQELFPRDM